MSIRVIKSGVLDSLQDNGRYGYAKWGINPSGTMDRFAAQVSNALVGNHLDEGLVEIHFPAGHFLFKEDVLISICGADFSPMIDSRPIPTWKTVHVKKNEVLTFAKNTWGCRCYLAVHGGFNIPKWLGSLSTHIKASAGGHEGRALKKDDEIPLHAGRYTRNEKGSERDVFTWSTNTNAVYNEHKTIAFLEGKEWKWLTTKSQSQLLSETVTVSSSSDRMASYLIHLPMKMCKQEELLSSAVNFGTIQALPSGNLIVLMADHQTTGGYPIIGNIISAHLPKFAQLRPHERFQFKMVSMADAEKMLFSLQQKVRIIQHACLALLDQHYDKY